MATSRLLLAPVQNAWKAPVSGGWNSVTYTWNKQFPRDALSKKCSKKFSKFADKHEFHAVIRRCSVKRKDVFKIFVNINKVSLLIKLQAGNLKHSEAATGDIL